MTDRDSRIGQHINSAREQMEALRWGIGALKWLDTNEDGLATLVEDQNPYVRWGGKLLSITFHRRHDEATATRATIDALQVFPDGSVWQKGSVGVWGLDAYRMAEKTKAWNDGRLQVRIEEPGLWAGCRVEEVTYPEQRVVCDTHT